MAGLASETDPGARPRARMQCGQSSGGMRSPKVLFSGFADLSGNKPSRKYDLVRGPSLNADNP
jgi:hypothetical protein